MASRKQAVSRKKGATPGQARLFSGNFPRFLKTVTVSALVSFAVGTGVLQARASEQPWSAALLPSQLLKLLPDSLSLGDLPDSLTPADLLAWGRERLQQVEPPPPLRASGNPVQTRFRECPEFFPNGNMPVVPAAPALRELCFTSFAILHSGYTKTPVFVAQRLNRRALAAARDIERSDRFYSEARLPRAERADLADYRGSGYARGHMAPAGDMASTDAMAQSFSLANMVPQHPIQNSGPWNRIEQDTRKYVQRAKGDVFVFTGPVYASYTKVIGPGQVAVPDYLFKVVYDAATGRSWVHWQTNGPDAVAGPPITYAEFVRRTGLHLLPAVRAEASAS